MRATQQQHRRHGVQPWRPAHVAAAPQPRISGRCRPQARSNNTAAVALPSSQAPPHTAAAGRPRAAVASLVARSPLRPSLTTPPHATPAAAAIEHNQQLEQEQQQDHSGFNSWTQHWWPVQVAATTDRSRPHAIELLGRQLVLWHDGAAWHVHEDACPHRLAPLSEGRIEADGTLQCSYHGWRFDGDGRCTEIPQALDAKARDTACASSRSCVASFPTREAYGLVWCFPDASPGAAAAAAASPLPVSKGLTALWAAKSPDGHQRWYRRELPYSFDMLLENLCCPSHLPFSHHRLTPNMLRDKAGPMPLTRLDVPSGDTPADAAARPSFSFAHAAPLAAFSFPSVLSPSGRVAFSPPGCVVYEYDLPGLPGAMIANDLLAAPAGPGRSVAYTLGHNAGVPTVTNGQIVNALARLHFKQALGLIFRARFQRQPLWREHLGMSKLFDQDSCFLHEQDQLLAQRGGYSAWRQVYYLPTQADSLVSAVRQWIEAAYALKLPGGGGLKQGAAPSSSSAAAAAAAAAGDDAPTAGEVLALSAAAAAAAPRLPARQLNDRAAQHTAHCTECQGAVARLRKRLQAAQAAAAACAAGLMGVLGAALASAVGAAPAAAAQQQGTAAAAVSGPGVAVVAAVLGGGALVAAWLAASAARQLALFEYVPFQHADNH